MRRAADRIVRAAAPLVPSDIRRDWRREWQAEIAHRSSRSSGLALFTRSLGAVMHAAWLRWDRWRIEMVLQDLRYALRTLTRKPGFAVVTVLTLALGIGANAAIFSAVRAVLLRPLPFPNPQQLVNVSATTVSLPNSPGGAASGADFMDWRRDNRSFSDIAAINAGSYALVGDGTAEQISGANVTGGFFNVLGVPALYGRTLLPEDDAAGTGDPVVISHGLWVRKFGSNPNVLGRTINLDGTLSRIVGIMPRGFAYPLASDVWLPQRFTENDYATQRGAHYLDVIGRLRPDVMLAQAAQDMDRIALRLASAFPSSNKDNRVSVHPLRDELVGDVRPAMLMLLGAVGFVLLIVCVNIANLVLTRAMSRTRETAIRTALGAGRFRLVRGVLIESLVVAAAGGIGGLMIAFWVTGGIAALQDSLGIKLLQETRVDGVVIAFTAAISILAALLFGTLPAWHTSAVNQIAQRIREDSANATGDRRRQRIRGSLIVAETALAVVLLVGAGLLMRSFMRLTSVDLGFDAHSVQTFNISLPDATYRQPMQRAEFVSALIAEIARRPDVEAAGGIFGLPLTDFRYVISMSTLDGRKLDNDEQMRRSLQVRVVTPDYFRALGIQAAQGRPLTDGDRIGAPLSIVINETAAARLWPGKTAIGREFTLGTRMGQGGANAGGTVVGVVRDVHDHGPAVAVRPTVYLAHAQFPVSFLTVTVRGRNGVVPIEPVRALVTQLDPHLPIYRVRTMEQLQSDAVAQPRVYLLLLGLFAVTAVVLASIGIYGVLMHAVAQRTREIGIRLALGARRGEVVGMVVRQAAVLALTGLAIGLGLAIAASGTLRTVLFGVQPTDLATYSTVAIGLFAIALIASYLPARRASRIDPVTALRYE
jgi:putative ABC transport system permease protein